jgi:endonuclease/exonuclease/phosphatase family metal-dependent hydrolase
MRLASINGSKRLRQQQSAFASWARATNPDVICAQEVSRGEATESVLVPGYTLALGQRDMATWVRDGLTTVRVTGPDDWYQRLTLDGLIVYSVHLDDTGTKGRAAQLTTLSDLTRRDTGAPLVIWGDFNIAPRPIDGLYGDAISGYNSPVDRVPLQRLMMACDLVDTGATDHPAFTFERLLNGRMSRFRCDLVLLSRDLAAATVVAYDHTVRIKPGGFTDHSAIIIELAVP